MNIKRSASALLPALILATLTLLLHPANSAYAKKPDCEVDASHPSCEDEPPTEGSIEYTAQLDGAFGFGPVIVTLKRNTLKSTSEVTLTRPGSDGPEKAMWNTVLSMPNDDLGRDCHLFGSPPDIETMTTLAGRKGETIGFTRGTFTDVGFSFELVSDVHDEDVPGNEDPPDPTTPDHMGLGVLNVFLRLSGACPAVLQDDSKVPCGNFPPTPEQTSTAVVTDFWFHAKGEGGITHEGEGCHLGTGALVPHSTLTVTAIICPAGQGLGGTPPTCQQ